MRPLMVVLALGGFFGKDAVDFWGSRKRAPAIEPGGLWSDSPAPPPVRRLLEAPSPENARAYLAWQEERLRRLRAATEAVERERSPILYFARDGCRWCALQEVELEGLSVTRVPEGSPLWEEHQVTATPTLVVRGKVHRGLTPRAAILKELGHE